MGRGEESDIRMFLDSLDITNNSWKDEAERWILQRLRSSSPRKRVARFSIGDEDYEPSDNETPLTNDASTQTVTDENRKQEIESPAKSLDEISRDWIEGRTLSASDALRLVKRGIVKCRELESRLDAETAIFVRRSYVAPEVLKELPYKNYDYKYVTNSCCENVIGYVPIPLGVAGPIPINGAEVYVPMATTEGALVASTNRGCSAIKRSGGVSTCIFDEGMTRAPVVRFPTASEAVKLKKWLAIPDNFHLVKTEFESTSRFAQLRAVEVAIDGNLAFVRFISFTGDAMGMNMVSKGCNLAMHLLKEKFPSMQLLALSGNYCVDKKAAAINWIQGRGRSVVADCLLPASVVLSIFKTTPKQMATAAQSKLQSGSDRAVCIGGNNAHAANVVAAIFLATGQDPAQVVSSSMCSTRMDVTEDGDLYVSCTMPCVEVGTVGGGTILRPQNECLQMLSCAGPSPTEPGAHARRLAEIICSTVLAGELSLMAALVTDQLVSSHMKLNRSRLQLYPSAPAMTMPSVEKSAPFLLKPPEKEPRVKRTIKVECSNIL
ncbi:Hydroxymethylglutaryl-coenzyme A reductase [Trichostrongylus colubriformis]|uniref:3-hydroxy-3-methylglutaryl coenzyme A reductase n=1 Tax=Trichostrongylus colubriformis TaxID=6319 RepID=A0AAN8FUV4_TRICO